jgi:hypothetical protein
VQLAWPPHDDRRDIERCRAARTRAGAPSRHGASAPRLGRVGASLRSARWWRRLAAPPASSGAQFVRLAARVSDREPAPRVPAGHAGPQRQLPRACRSTSRPRREPGRRIRSTQISFLGVPASEIREVSVVGRQQRRSRRPPRGLLAGRRRELRAREAVRARRAGDGERRSIAGKPGRLRLRVDTPYRRPRSRNTRTRRRPPATTRPSTRCPGSRRRSADRHGRPTEIPPRATCSPPTDPARARTGR